MSNLFYINNTKMTTSLVPIYFKLAHTGENAIFDVPTNICIANFIILVKNQAYLRFNIPRNQEIEIVEAGQDIPGLSAEEAPALHNEFNRTVRQKYNGVYTHLAFYIRFRLISYINNEINYRILDNDNNIIM